VSGGEFESIARLFRPLTGGAPEALSLLDDAAVIVPRPGCELVVTADAIVEGVHFLRGDPPELVARKLLRVNLSDLAAKAAEPDGWFLTVAWPAHWDGAARAAFAAGLAQDQAEFGLRLFGGDTVSTPGPFAASATLLGWAPLGSTVKRSTARPGDVLLVSGTIGDGRLGLLSAQGGLPELGPGARAWLAERYRLPRPRLALREALRAHASAAADVSDGLLADAGHIGEASGTGIAVRLDAMPLSDEARAWLALQPDEAAARLDLATGGDDYEIVCTARSDRVEALRRAAARAFVPLTVIGEVTAAPGLEVSFNGARLEAARTGWSHP